MTKDLSMLSIFDIFTPGIGPSSSHTIGPMRAAKIFVDSLSSHNRLTDTTQVCVELYGSLALTGIGHGTDHAIIMGLENCIPETIDPDHMQTRLKEIEHKKILLLGSAHSIHFDPAGIIHHNEKTLAYHSNAMKLSAYDEQHTLLQENVFYSIGGGVVIQDGEVPQAAASIKQPKYKFSTATELLQICKDQNCAIADIMLENEKTLRSDDEIQPKILELANIMTKAIKRGESLTGLLPGGLNVKRRAGALCKRLEKHTRNADHSSCSCHTSTTDHCQQDLRQRAYIGAEVMCFVSSWALAVAEENAAGGRIVVAPTCGSAGVLPAVLEYYKTYFDDSFNNILKFLLTAAAIEILYKEQASISGAEVGCQGEIGVACSMAAAALTAVLGGSPLQIEKAAEIGIEHHLGLTCDPIKGLVQIPCIERNLAAATQAITIAHLVLNESVAEHHVSLDKAIKVMKETGLEMNAKYKETALGGLALNIPNCS